MKIVWIESDVVFRSLQSDQLTTLGYEVHVVSSVEEGLFFCQQADPVVFVYDRSFQSHQAYLDLDVLIEKSIPLILILGFDENEKKEMTDSHLGPVVTLKRPMSAEDFIWAIRTFQGVLSKWISPYRYRFGGLILDEVRREVVNNKGKVSRLTLSELKILRLILFYPDRTFTCTDLKVVLCGDNYRSASSIKVHIRNIRNKIGSYYIRTIWGGGYSFASPKIDRSL